MLIVEKVLTAKRRLWTWSLAGIPKCLRFTASRAFVLLNGTVFELNSPKTIIPVKGVFVEVAAQKMLLTHRFEKVIRESLSS